MASDRATKEWSSKAADVSAVTHDISRLPARTVVGFVLGVVAVISIAVLNAQFIAARSSASAQVSRTLEVIAHLERVSASLKDAETGQRGFLLTGEDLYLAPYTTASATLPAEFKVLRDLLARSDVQNQRLDNVEQLTREKFAELDETLRLRRAGKQEAALAIVRTDRGLVLMNGIRAELEEIRKAEQQELELRQSQWDEITSYAGLITWGGSGLLLFLIGAAALVTSRDHAARETAVWIRAGNAAVGTRLIGQPSLNSLADDVLRLMAGYLDAQSGAFHVVEDHRSLRRVAGFALSNRPEPEVMTSGESLVGQAAKENRILHIRDVPAEYLTVSSGLGRAKPAEVLVFPAAVDGVVHAVIEFGFFRRTRPADRELMARVSDAVGAAVRSMRDRMRVDALLSETQRQAEELQAQQEELRVNNEELEEQSRALRESQQRLEAQQAELEQTNSQLEEQAQMLETQRDDLSRAQAGLTERAQELERANKFKSEFLANMSHELRTPLNSSLILAKLLADNSSRNLTPEQVEFAETIHAAGNDLLALINDILDLSKIEAGGVELESQAVPLPRLVEGLARSFQPIAERKGLKFSAALQPGAPEQIETDPRRLGQILKNLIANALKFTESGEVSLRVRPVGEDKVAFAVSDTGIGIPAHQHEIIFEAFRQADGSTHRKHGGTGLGLSISRDLAHLLGGNIDLESALDRGSVFTLVIPRILVVADGSSVDVNRTTDRAPSGADSRRLPRRGTTTEPVRSNTAPVAIFADDDREHLNSGARTILVIEDDVSFAAILRELANELGFQCVVAHSAEEGLSAAERYEPSAIVLDIHLPDHSGLGVLDQLKRNSSTRHIPVHCVSVADHSQEARESGAIGYALKPVKREELIAAFRRLEAKMTQTVRRVLVVEDDARQRESIRLLLANGDVEITGVETAKEALSQLRSTTFDCMVMDLNLPDSSGYDLLEGMGEQEGVSCPPVIVYTGGPLTRDEEQGLRRFARSIIIKDVRSPERLLDEVTLFLHQVESQLPVERQRMLKVARDRDTVLEGKRILIVEDDVRNIFALSRVLEPKGVKLEIARNGREALEALKKSRDAGGSVIDLVLMDIMMPEMDGLTAMREIRKQPDWKKLPIIALTAKAMRDDHEQCVAAGANDYIAKPLDVVKLLSLVRVWMPK